MLLTLWSDGMFFFPPRALTVSHQSKWQEKHKKIRTSKNSEGKADRCKKENSKNIQVTKKNFNVLEYSETINCMDCELSSFPFLAEISDNEIKSQTDSDSIPNWIINVKQIPVYIQAVEGCVKLVKKASGKNCGTEFGVKFIRIPLLSRLSMPNFTSKSVFKVPSAAK